MPPTAAAEQPNSDYGQSTEPIERPASLQNEEFDHWHASIDWYLCDHFERADAPLADVDGDGAGLHSHDDGVIHVHPFLDEAAGRNARLGLFLDAVGVGLADDRQLSFPDGEVWSEEGSLCGGPMELVVAAWDDAEDAAAGLPPSVVQQDDLRDLRFTNDRMAIVVAAVLVGVRPPAPPAVLDRLDHLADG